MTAVLTHIRDLACEEIGDRLKDENSAPSLKARLTLSEIFFLLHDNRKFKSFIKVLATYPGKGRAQKTRGERSADPLGRVATA